MFSAFHQVNIDDVEKYVAIEIKTATTPTRENEERTFRRQKFVRASNMEEFGYHVRD